ncbi:MAG TPA: hypothetical protein DDZ67_07970, partial [Xanthomonadaceae bacterium]|nr:hypothetical protein [Xanthomonadaceae bacterium]
MKPLVLGVLVAGLAIAGSASAQQYRDGGYYGDEGYYGSRDDDRSSGYDYARVVRVDPIIVSDYGGRQDRRCYDRPADGYVDRNGGYDDGRYAGSGGNDSGRTLATVVGGVAGAVLGSRVGGGNGQLLGTAVRSEER